MAPVLRQMGRALSLGRWSEPCCMRQVHSKPAARHERAIKALPELQCMLLMSWHALRWNPSHSALSRAGMLRRNYRSPPRLIELSSRMFYQDRLIASADPAKVRAPAWSELQRNGAGGGGFPQSGHRVPAACNRPRPDPFPAVSKLQCNRQDSDGLPGPACARKVDLPDPLQLCTSTCSKLQHSTTPCLQQGYVA